MARVIAIGQPVNDSEREVTARHDAIGRERGARALVEHWIETQGAA